MSSDNGRSRLADRLSRNHGTILAVVRSVEPGTHLTAQDVHARARLAAPRIGFATVHRGLTRLSELGYIEKVEIPGATAAVYEHADTSHAHFRCSGCGDIRDIEYCFAEADLARLAKQLGVQIAAAATSFAGRCEKCLATQRAG